MQNSGFDWDNYDRIRDQFDSIRVNQQEALDKSILTISSSALGASLFLIQNYSQNNKVIEENYLLLTWFSFGSAILIILFSYFTGAKSAAKDIEQLDDSARSNSWEIPERNMWVGLTNKLNFLGLLLFAVGVLSMFYFAYMNTIGVQA